MGKKHKKKHKHKKGKKKKKKEKEVYNHWKQPFRSNFDDLIEKMIETSSRIGRMRIAGKIRGHPSTESCKDVTCQVCAMRDCPYKEPLHYHQDGCPACYWHRYTPEQQIIRDRAKSEGVNV